MLRVSKITDEQINELTFEQATERLESIVNKLESGEVPLENSIELFHEGMKLAKHCHQKLEKAELKIDKILEKDGELIKRPFEYEEDKE